MQYEKKKNFLKEREKNVQFYTFFPSLWKYVYFLWERGGLTSLCLFIGFHKPESDNWSTYTDDMDKEAEEKLLEIAIFYNTATS